MAFEDEPLERAYPYRVGWKVMGCTSLAFAVATAAGFVLVPVCCDQWRNGQNVAFAALVVMGAPCTLLAGLFAAVGLIAAARDAFRPPLLRVTPSALLLPVDARGVLTEKDEKGNPKQDGPRTHPEEVPFAAIRWVRREAGETANNEKLLIVHDLSTVTLELHQNMMRPDDFDELEMVLRAAVPEAFVALPVPPPPPPTPPDDGV